MMEIGDLDLLNQLNDVIEEHNDEPDETTPVEIEEPQQEEK